MAALLRKLQVFKSTADVQRAGDMFNGYSRVTPELLALRPIVQAREKARPLFLQPVLRLAPSGGAATSYGAGVRREGPGADSARFRFCASADDVVLEEHDPSPGGLVASFLARFADETTWAPALLAQHARDAHHFHL